MRFEFSVALKYLLPRWRQLSVSIISLLSVLVISLVVWLVVVFLSVTSGIEKKWVEELVALNGPLRLTPTETYYRSYYYQADSVAQDSNFTSKTIGEKLTALTSDPYDPTVDAQLPENFPKPDLAADGSIKDIIKEGWNSITALNEYPGLRPQEYEISLGSLRLALVRPSSPTESTQTVLTQVSYVASFDGANNRFHKLLLPPSVDDLNNLLASLQEETGSPAALQAFFQDAGITALRTAAGVRIPDTLYPQEGTLKAVGILSPGGVRRVVIPESAARLDAIEARLSALGTQTVRGTLSFNEGRSTFTSSEGSVAEAPLLTFDSGIVMPAKLVDSSLVFEVAPKLQGLTFKGALPYDHFEIASASPSLERAATEPYWVYQSAGRRVVPTSSVLGEGVLISKNFQKSGVRLGDRGHLSYYAESASSAQEQRLPIYVAGFYDPGLVPVGNKLILVDEHLIAQMRGSLSIADNMLGNGITVWLKNTEDAPAVKAALQEQLKARGIEKYWNVESYKDYEFSRPVLQQLQSDKTLFTLIAIIILVVACSNIISMLILLVNDKRKEVGIMQSMGASARRIATIFGLCGFLTGFISSVIGTAAAILTLRNLQGLVDFLSFLQGHEAFQSAFYGSAGLPNELSVNALVFVLVATTIISLLAGIVPAIKAARIRPSEILRSE